MEEVSAAGGAGVTKTAAAEAGAGNKAVVAETGAEAGNKVVAEAGKKRTKTMRVQQAYIDSLLEEYPFRPFPGDPEELEKNIQNPEKRELLRIMMAPITASIKACQDKDEAIIKQYLAQGYAEEEVQVSDDDDEA